MPKIPFIGILLFLIIVIFMAQVIGQGIPKNIKTIGIGSVTITEMDLVSMSEKELENLQTLIYLSVNLSYAGVDDKTVDKMGIKLLPRFFNQHKEE